MKYDRVKEGVFVSRPNRFIAQVLIDGQPAIAHVKNTGRCRELLLPGAHIWLQESEAAHRRTHWDLISVESAGQVINIDSQVPNEIAREYCRQLFPDATNIRREVTFGDSRFDLMVERPNMPPTYVEVKGVTLKVGEEARFPDAPTTRGVKHIHGLIDAAEQGYGAALLFVVAMGNVSVVRPNYDTDPAFAQALGEAERRGVNLYAVDCTVTGDSICYNRELSVKV